MRTRVFLNTALSSGTTLDTDKDRAQYLGRVLRMKPGDTLRVFNDRDGEFAAAISAIRRDRVALRIDELLVNPGDATVESPLDLHLVQAVSRGERMDLVVQKATELGVRSITPVLSQYGIVRLDENRAAKRQSHWQRIATSATEQCGRLSVPAVNLPVDLNAWFGATSLEGGNARRWILDTRGGETVRKLEWAAPQPIYLLIGPEGGFSDREYGDADAAGFRSVSLGPRVLRTETAGIAAVAVLQAQFGDLMQAPD